MENSSHTVPKGIVLAGSASGVGKTVATLAVIRRLQNDGYEVQPAKAGPDFIDPSHHAVVAGKASRTLDIWMQGEQGLLANYAHGTGDICVIEGVMGLYDGSETSTATIAEVLDLPVILVVDGSARMESVGAEALGYREYARQQGIDIEVIGIIAQQVHGGRHENGIRDALPDGISYFGRIPTLEGLDIPERHLGLHMGDEAGLSDEILEEAAEQLFLDRIIDVARTPRSVVPASNDGQTTKRVALAHDAAFRFVYPAVRERLQERATVIEFSPTAGEDVPPCDGLYLPGGYPELHAEALAKSKAVETIAELASEGLPILGECGGMMVLAESMRTVDGSTYPMAGILPANIRMHEQFQALDHVKLRATDKTLTAAFGETHVGHEFHYSRATADTDAQFAFEMLRGTGFDETVDGLQEYRTLGTYCHLHAASGAYDTFVERL